MLRPHAEITDSRSAGYVSELLASRGIPHLFGSRAFDAAPAAVTDATRTALLSLAGCGRAHWAGISQVHGCDVAVTEAPSETPHAADAHLTTMSDIALVIRVADCVPILLAADDGSVVAAAHAGWRGTVAGVVTRTVQAVTAQTGIKSDGLVAAIGPAISAAHFEVGEEVVDAFAQAGLGDTVVRSDHWPKPHIDLHAAVRRQLVNAGLRDEHIDGNDLCTYRDADLFFSYRREGEQAGRMAAVIARPS